jgi:hypothetical protein
VGRATFEGGARGNLKVTLGYHAVQSGLWVASDKIMVPRKAPEKPE